MQQQELNRHNLRIRDLANAPAILDNVLVNTDAVVAQQEALSLPMTEDAPESDGPVDVREGGEAAPATSRLSAKPQDGVGNASSSAVASPTAAPITQDHAVSEESGEQGPEDLDADSNEESSTKGASDPRTGPTNPSETDSTDRQRPPRQVLRIPPFWAA